MAALKFAGRFVPIRLSFINPCRYYSIQPPEWLGGVNRLTAPSRHEFPEHEQTFQQKMAG